MGRKINTVDMGSGDTRRLAGIIEMARVRRSPLRLRVFGMFFAFVALLSLSGCALSIVQTRPVVNVAGKGISAPLQVQHDASGSTVVLIQVTIDGQGPYPFAVDTGASVSLIDSGLARQLGLPKNGSTTQISGVGGTQQVVPVQLRQWNAGDIRLPSATVASAELPTAQRAVGIRGLLGSDVLSQFGAFLLDYSNQKLTVYTQVSDVPGGAFRSRSA